MNKPILDWIERIKNDYPKLFWKNRVVEFGALNVNGSPRSKFDEPTEYIGVDAQAGDGVDIRALTHEYQNGEFDVVVSTEMLEHDPYWDLSFNNMLHMVKIGGSLIMTCAGPSRHPHGQATYTPLNHYYRNISCSDMYGVLGKYNFKKIYVDNKDDSFISLFCFHKF